jgi:hypothetical protein
MAIRDLGTVCDRFLESGLLPSAQGVEWGRPGGSATRDDVARLQATIAEMARTCPGDRP